MRQNIKEIYFYNIVLLFIIRNNFIIFMHQVSILENNLDFLYITRKKLK